MVEKEEGKVKPPKPYRENKNRIGMFQDLRRVCERIGLGYWNNTSKTCFIFHVNLFSSKLLIID